MKFEFCKYHGTGNDFILIDNRNGDFAVENESIQKMCHRRFGIGADGLILLEKSNQVDFKMRYFNSDGLEGSMCGNGGRCITAFAHKLKIIDKDALFEATDGLHQATILNPFENETRVRLKMSDVSQIEKKEDFFFINTGSPHHVLFTDHVTEMDVYTKGKEIRYNSTYKEIGTNVDFVEIKGDQLFVRTYERGVEEETLSCGTGVTAAAIAYSQIHSGVNKVMIHTLGGILSVDFKKSEEKYTDVWLEGPTVCVYSGYLNILL
jgi:diaminopimelate epimerase